MTPREFIEHLAADKSFSVRVDLKVEGASPDYEEATVTAVATVEGIKVGIVTASDPAAAYAGAASAAATWLARMNLAALFKLPEPDPAE